MLFSDLKKKQVVNLVTGCCMGNVSDLIFDERSSSIRALVVPGNAAGFWQRLKSNSDLVIPWSCIDKIGNDVILAHVDTYACLDEKGHGHSRMQKI